MWEFFFGVVLAIALSLILIPAPHIPAFLHLLAIMYTDQGCMPPQGVPTNAGNIVVADLRQPGNGTHFLATPREAWINETIARLRSETNSTRDLVVFVHGFRTTFGDAKCMGNILRADLAGLPAYALTSGPDIFVFGWPGEFEVWQFQAARHNARRAGLYLSGVLQGLAGRRIIIVAHSLGAEVVMTAADNLPEHDHTPPLVGMLLIEGAIPAVSIRTWKSTFTQTHSYIDMENLLHNKPLSSPYVDPEGGVGEFVAAAAKATHLVVTTAGDDIPLKDAFILNETFFPSTQNGPIIPAEIGDSVGNQIEKQAIGTPFPSGKIYRHFDELMPNLQQDFPPNQQSEMRFPIYHLFPADSQQVLNSDDWVFEYQVLHPSYHEIRLGEQWWGESPLYDWHDVMNDKIMRHRILSESWAVFTGQKK